MERLLKIVEGPMKGAEIALVAGTRVKVGRGEDCDIVIADASLSETAFELDVSEAAVTLITPDGTAREVQLFVTYVFGTTAFALGPAEGVWEELRPAAPETPPEPEPEPAAAAPTESPAAPAAAAPQSGRRRRRGCGFGCLVVILLLAACLWYFRQRLAERVPQLRSYVGSSASTVTVREAPQVLTPAAKLQALAKQYGLAYEERDGLPVLKGNFAHRTERMAIRALALAEDRRCGLDLSDDETLASSVEAMLSMVTEGALKLLAATNRTVVLSGFAPSAAALDDAMKALREDVPWASAIEVGAVRVGGPVPAAQRESAFAVSGVLTSARPTEESEKKAAETPDIQIADENGRKLPRNLFPVAGILTRPYPCVVLRDGHRIVEGGQLGAYTVVRIGADRLELKQESGQANWEP